MTPENRAPAPCPAIPAGGGRIRLRRLERTLAAALGTLVLLGAVPTEAASEGTAEQYIKPGLEALELGLLSTAETALAKVWNDQTLRLTDAGEAAGFYLGIIRERSGDLEGAVRYFGDLLGSFPAGKFASEARAHLGVVLGGLGRWGESLQSLEGVRSEDLAGPLAEDVVATIALGRMATGDLRAAIQGWESFPARFPESPRRGEAAAYRLIALGRLKQWKDVVAGISAIDREAVPPHLKGTVLLTVADATEAEGNVEGAVEWFRRAAEATSDPREKVSATLAGARLLSERLGRGPDGEALLATLKEEDLPQELMPEYMETKGRILAATGKGIEGKETLAKTARAYGDKPEGWRAALTLIAVLSQTGDWQGVAREAEALAGIITDPATVKSIRWWGAQAYVQTGQWDKAGETLKGLAVEDAPFPSREDVDLLSAQVLARRGKEREAVDLLARIPTDKLTAGSRERWILEMTGAKLRLGDYKGVMNDTDAYVKGGASLPAAGFFARVEALRQLGRIGEAEGSLRSVAEGPDAAARSEALYLLGLVLMEAGKKQEAMASFKKVIDSPSGLPKKGDALLAAAGLAYDMGRFKEATTYAVEGSQIAAGAERARGLYLAARSAEALKRYKESRGYLVKILKEHAEAHPWSELSEMGIAYDDERKEDYKGALERYRRVVKRGEDQEIKKKAAERIKVLEEYLGSKPKPAQGADKTIAQ